MKAWDKLSSKHGRGPKLTNEDICMDCLIAGARNVVCAYSYRDWRISMKEIALSALSEIIQMEHMLFLGHEETISSN
ncbi:hypothetical protein IC582_026319 [Cucumis melo]